jgi:hypothetical protein
MDRPRAAVIMVQQNSTELDRVATTRYPWLTPAAQARVRAVLLGVALFVGLVVWVWHSLGAPSPLHGAFIRKLRVVGIMTWLYALVQILDMRFWHSGVARRRRLSLGIPESLIAWLFGQMLAWFGIIYYGFTEDARWYAGGLLVLLLTFVAFPIRRDD